MTLSTKLNASGSGLGRFVKAVGRSMVSGESSFITQVVSQSNNGYIALAPDSPGQVIPLYLGEKQYRLNDGAFLALDGTAYYLSLIHILDCCCNWHVDTEFLGDFVGNLCG